MISSRSCLSSTERKEMHWFGLLVVIAMLSEISTFQLRRGLPGGLSTVATEAVLEILEVETKILDNNLLGWCSSWLSQTGASARYFLRFPADLIVLVLALNPFRTADVP